MGNALFLLGFFALCYSVPGGFAVRCYRTAKGVDEFEPVYGIEYVGAFCFWWVVLPVAAVRLTATTLVSVARWLFTKQ